MKRFVMVIALCVGLGAIVVASLARGAKADDKAAQERNAWVAKCLEDFQKIKPGMTLTEARVKLQPDGGLTSGGTARYVHRECPYFKIDLELGKDEAIVKVSKPYLEAPDID